MKRDKEYFKGKCPYTDKPCDYFNCDTCEVEANERKWMSDLLYGYDSPITMIAGEVTTSMEDGCLKVVQSYGFNVDRDELAKALAYDRDQYDKGYADAKKKYARPTGEWIEENSETGALGIKYTWFRCNQCGWDNSLVIPRNFCPNCGADMRGEESETDRS